MSTRALASLTTQGAPEHATLASTVRIVSNVRSKYFVLLWRDVHIDTVLATFTRNIFVLIRRDVRTYRTAKELKLAQNLFSSIFRPKTPLVN